jgi:hypothetical protein
MSKPRLVFHLGFPKTGTTFLQTQVFPNLSGIRYLGRTYHRTPKSFLGLQNSNGLNLDRDNPAEHLVKEMVCAEDEAFRDADLHAAWKRLVDPGRVNVVCHENLLRPQKQERVISRLAALKEDFEIRLMVNIREQFDAIWSRYCHDMRVFRHRRYTLRQALDLGERIPCQWPYCQEQKWSSACPCRQAKVKSISLSYYDYLHLHDLFQRHFSSYEFRFFVFEDFEKDPAAHVQTMLGFIDSDLALESNGPLPKSSVNVGDPGVAERCRTINAGDLDSLRVEVGARFAPGNKLLGERIGRPTETLGTSRWPTKS